MPIIRITWEATGTEYEVAFVCDGNSHLDAKFVFFVGLAFADTLGFCRMKTVNFVFIQMLLIQNMLGFFQGFLESLTDIQRLIG